MAIRFDAAGEGLSRSANLPSATAFTLCGWFNIRGSGAGTNEYLFVIGDTGGTDSLVFYTRVSGTYGVQLYSPAAGAPVSAGSISTGQWYFGALSCAGTGATDAKARFAALGATTFSSASVPGVAFTPATLAVGDTLSHGQWANAAVAGWKLFDRALTDAELLAEMYRLTPASTTNLNVWTPMVHNSVANAVKDFSGNGRDWTAVGTLSVEDGPPVGWGGRVTVVGQAAAGTTYDDSLTESVTAADSLANSATFGPSLSESATVADSYATAATFESALTESVAADDALAAGQVMPVALAESATVADDYAATVSKDETITESVTAADSVAAAQVFAETITESVAAADAYSSAQTMASAVSESATVSDSLADSQDFADALTESVTAADSYADEYVPKGTFDDTLTETVTASDSYAVTQVHVADVIELASVADGYAATGGTLLSSGQTPAGRPSRSKRRRVVIGERVYEVPERDIPALLEATLLDRMPPKTAEVVAGPKPVRKPKAAPVRTAQEVRQAVETVREAIRPQPDSAWLVAALEAVARRVVAQLEDEEEALMLLLAA